MPDIERKSVSASQASALLDASPYITKFMLYRWLKHGDDISSPDHNRMDWGTKMEPLCLAQAAEDLRLEVIPTRQADGTQPYVRNGLLGCTRDARIICPDRGPGALESKCVFDNDVWYEQWEGGKKVPRHIEIQLQAQMLVGDGMNSDKWGITSVWHCAEQTYFERKPIPKLWDLLLSEAKLLFDAIASGQEIDPFGSADEIPLLLEAFPQVIGNPLDLSKPSTDQELVAALRVAEDVRMLEYVSRERLGFERDEKGRKARLLAFAKDHDEVLLPHGIRYRVSEVSRAGYTVAPSKYRQVKIHVPANLPEGDISAMGIGTPQDTRG